MKKLILLIIYIFFFIETDMYGQNLVPNPSFEEFSQCPDTIPDIGINSATYWYNPGGFSPDYFNPCDTNIVYPYYGVPLNQYGNQSARTGNAYAGIISSYLYSSPDSVREYISAKLLNTLSAGKTYQVSFYVSLADFSVYAANDIGVYFSDTIVYRPSYPYPLPFTPQIQNNPISNPLIEKNNWIEVKNNFIAQGGEQYIIIGNFKNDINTDTTNLEIGNPDGTPWAYYYIDDVAVICLDCTVGLNKFDDYIEKVKIYPNPATDFLNIEFQDLNLNHIELFNPITQKILSLSRENLQGDNLFQINLKQFNKGVYFLKIKFENNQSFIYKLIIH